MGEDRYSQQMAELCQNVSIEVATPDKIAQKIQIEEA